MFFVAKKEEAQAINQFKKTCTYHGLTVRVSLHALTALKQVVEAKLKGEPADVGERDIYTLGRRGLVRTTGDGEIVVTELGLLVTALAEAGGLIITKSKKVTA
jgi:hypothetical protein